MSEEHRKTVRVVVTQLAQLVVEREAKDNAEALKLMPPGPERIEMANKMERERGLMFSVGNLIAHVLCDLNRIADSLETLASPPASPPPADGAAA